MNMSELPGSEGEHALQKKHKTQQRAERFYEKEMHASLTESMQAFLQEQKMVFISTADKHGECDSSFRSGEQGFVAVLSEDTLIYPEFKGNGVMASLGNIVENGHIGLLFIDFLKTHSGLHINGKAEIIEAKDLESALEEDAYNIVVQKAQECQQKQVVWVKVTIEEAYIHCSRNIPHFKEI